MVSHDWQCVSSNYQEGITGYNGCLSRLKEQVHTNMSAKQPSVCVCVCVCVLEWRKGGVRDIPGEVVEWSE